MTGISKEVGWDSSPVRVRVLVADDHPAVRDEVIRVLEPSFDVVGQATTGRELITQVRRLMPDVVVADVEMPDLSGLEASEELLARNPRLLILLLTVHDDGELARRALRAGVRGYLLKISAGEELLEAMRSILSGNTFVSRTVSVGGL